jgi:hypothetical protein
MRNHAGRWTSRESDNIPEPGFSEASFDAMEAFGAGVAPLVADSAAPGSGVATTASLPGEERTETITVATTATATSTIATTRQWAANCAAGPCAGTR